jgi:predicted nucleic acid-binding protein
VNYLFDTNVVSAARRPERLPRHVARWLAQVPQSRTFISVVSLLEIEVGVRRLERTDPAQGAVLRRWKSMAVAEAFRGRTLPVDEAIAEACAGLHVPDPKPHLDALIAATAIIHRLIVVTGNVADFEPMGVAVVDPWRIERA